MARHKSFIELNANQDDAGRVYWRNKWRFIELPEEAKLAAYSVAKDTADVMEARAPIGNIKSPRRIFSKKRPRGRLKSNIVPYETDKGGGVEWNASGTADHWEAIEFGVPDNHPIVGKPRVRVGKTWTNGGITFVGHHGPRKGDLNVPAVNHPGNAPQPYIRPSIDWGKIELWNRVTGGGFELTHGGGLTSGSRSVFTKARMSESRGGKKPL